jgi:hypothetical protein
VYSLTRLERNMSTKAHASIVISRGGNYAETAWAGDIASMVGKLGSVGLVRGVAAGRYQSRRSGGKIEQLVDELNLAGDLVLA